MSSLALRESPHLIVRDRLLRRLDHAVAKRLTLVQGPAGSGKRVLLSQWLDANPDATCVVIAMDASDHDRDLVDLVDHELSKVPADAVEHIVVIDDRDPHPSTELAGQIRQLLDALPARAHLVVASRAVPGLPPQRLRLTDEVVEIDPGDLAFDRDETSQLLAAITGRPPSDTQIDEVLDITEGAAGEVGRAAMTMAADGSLDLVALINDAAVGDVIEAASDSLQALPEFIADTSVLTTFTVSLCHAVTERIDAEAMLRALQRYGAVVSIDAGGQRFRYRNAFRAAARRRLHQTDPERETTVLDRAATWHHDRGDLDTAVTYLADGGLWERVLDVIRAQARVLRRRDPRQLLGWIDVIPTVERAEHRDLGLLEADLAVLTGDLRRCHQALARLQRDPTIRADNLCLIDLVKAQSVHLSSTPHDEMAGAERVLTYLDSGGPPPRAPVWLETDPDRIREAALVARGTAEMYAGLNDAARATFAQEPTTGPFPHAIDVARSAQLALLDAWEGRLVTARRGAAEALTSADVLQLSGPSVAVARLAKSLVASSCGELGDRDLLDRAASAVETTSSFVLAAELAVQQARLAADLGDVVAGLAALDTTASDLPPALSTRRAVAEARLHLTAHDLPAAERVLASARWWTPQLETTQLQLAVMSRDLSKANACLERLNGTTEPRATLERDLWRCVVHRLDGRESEALDELESVVDAAEAAGDLRALRSAGGSGHGLLRALHGIHPRSFLRRAVYGFGPVASAPSPDGDATLTKREHEILMHLADESSNADIAADLDVSVNTLRTHLKSLYRKLGASGRHEAVTTAGRLGLM